MKKKKKRGKIGRRRGKGRETKKKTKKLFSLSCSDHVIWDVLREAHTIQMFWESCETLCECRVSSMLFFLHVLALHELELVQVLFQLLAVGQS